MIVCHPQHWTIFLLSTDRTLAPLEILQRYGYRFRIELGFRQAVHVLGADVYHFWMCGMKPLKRGDGTQHLHRTSDAYRVVTFRKMRVFHLHVRLGCIAQGLLQHLAINHTAEVWRSFRSWLRTMNPALLPSELVTANELRTAISQFISSSGMDPNFKIILDQYKRPDSWVKSCPLLYSTSIGGDQHKQNVLGTWFLSILAGHHRYSHITALRGGGVSPQLLGMSKIVSEDALRRRWPA